MNRPSSTITMATLAGMGMAVVWEVVASFTEITPTAGLIAGSVALVSGLVGYFTKETVLPLRPVK